MAEVTREEMVEALRRCIQWREAMERNWRGTALGEGARAEAEALSAILRELGAGGWRAHDFGGYAEFSTSGWDGFDAKPIAAETLDAARHLYEHLQNVPPDVAPGADGTIGFQWQFDERHFLIIEVGPGRSYQARIVAPPGTSDGGRDNG